MILPQFIAHSEKQLEYLKSSTSKLFEQHAKQIEIKVKSILLREETQVQLENIQQHETWKDAVVVLATFEALLIRTDGLIKALSLHHDTNELLLEQFQKATDTLSYAMKESANENSYARILSLQRVLPCIDKIFIRVHLEILTNNKIHEDISDMYKSLLKEKISLEKLTEKL